MPQLKVLADGIADSVIHMFARELPGTIIFGFLGIAMLLLGFVIFDKLLPKLDFQVELGEKRNYPLAIVIAVFLFSIAWIITTAMH